ncbi:MAG: hypothetical protein GY913_31120 [Proteobacteria bacterium]|nr:hypothetical protein [Pseudomonadota bacterium]MCP4921370.1 hypothetical protein [Pseudomonadota bacterium]
MWLLLLGCGPSTLGEATRYDDIRRLVEDGALVGQTELTLVDRGLGPEIGELLLEHGRELEELDLTGNLVGTRGAVALAQLGALKELRLGPGRAYIDGNGLQDAGVAALVAGELDQLQVLDLTRNRLGPESGASLATGLPALEKLVLDSNALRDEGATALAARPLDTLHLGWNGVGDAGAISLSGGRYETLLLASNDIGPTGAAALAATEGLETLYLSGNEPGDAATLLSETLGDGLRLE